MGGSALVIFDCDGALVDTERLVQAVDMQMISELGWPITRDEILEQHLGRSEAAVTENIERHLEQPVPPDFVLRRHAAYMRAFSRHLTEVPGVRAVAEALLVAGHDMCVASSGSHERMALTLGRTGLLPLFEGRIFSATKGGQRQAGA
ncbi:MAG: HAD family hydrolase [Nocardioidaceae bacterium]